MNLKKSYEKVLAFLANYLEKDKLMHGYLAGVTYPFILVLVVLLPVTLLIGVFIALFIMATIAFGKEYLDSKSPIHTSDIYDVYYTMSLPILISVMVLILNYIYKG